MAIAELYVRWTCFSPGMDLTARDLPPNIPGMTNTFKRLSH